jgi:DNA (cytosine-5)-methyltransferase 1
MRCVELFAGAGGAALGLEEAGVEHLALVEWDKDACATMRAAGLGPVIEGDVRDLHSIESVLGITEEQAWNRAGNMLLDDPREGDDWMMAREALASQLLDPDLDLLWSSFPCQGWSSAGARLGARDPRNGWPWTVAAIDRLQPRWFLGENVRGLTMHSGCASELDCPGCYLRGVIVPQLEERFAHAGYWVLDAADYGVPQHRRRVILWAGPAPLQAPAPTHGPPGQGDLFRRLKPWVTMGETLGLGSFIWDAARNNDRNPRQERPTPSTEPAPALGTKGNQYILRPAPTVTAQEVKGTRASEASGGTFNGGPDRASDALYLATGRRRLTVEECAALQSFPPDHPWRGTKRSKYQQVGNAVPPPLARVVAQRVLEADASLT